MNFLKRKLIESLIGHPILASTELISFTPDYYKNGEKLQYKAMSGYLSIDERITIRKNCDKYQLRNGKTFVIGMNQLLGNYLNADITTNPITDTGGTPRSTGTISSLTAAAATAAAGVSTYGNVVGSNNTTVARTDTKLNTQIAAGATASTLTHGAGSINAVTNPSGTITRTSVQRSYTGNAGSTVNIQEDGLYVLWTSNSWKICLYRNINNFGAVGAAQVVTHTINVDTTS